MTLLEPLALEEDRAALGTYVQRVYGPMGARLGFTPPADPVLALLQPDFLWALLETGKSPALLAEAKRLADAWIRTRGTAQKPVHDAFLGTVLFAALANGDKALYARYRDVALSPATPREDQRHVFAALGAAPTKELLDDALALLLDPKVDLREASQLAFAALASHGNREQAFAFLLAHMAEITARMRDDDASHMLQIAWGFCDDEHAARAESALTPIAARIDGGKLALQKSLEHVRACAKTRDERAAALHSFLTSPATLR